MVILVKNIRRVQKNLPATNAVVYYFPPTATERKKFYNLATRRLHSRQQELHHTKLKLIKKRFERIWLLSFENPFQSRQLVFTTILVAFFSLLVLHLHQLTSHQTTQMAEQRHNSVTLAGKTVENRQISRHRPVVAQLSIQPNIPHHMILQTRCMSKTFKVTELWLIKLEMFLINCFWMQNTHLSECYLYKM